MVVTGPCSQNKHYKQLLLIVNTYLATPGETQADFEETLDEVYEVISKYGECSVI